MICLWHRWKIVGITTLQWQKGPPETLIQYRCRCGKIKTRTIEGIWTLAQLSP